MSPVFTSIKKKRVLALLALVPLFLAIAGPSGGYFERSRIDWSIVWSAVATVGIPAVLLFAAVRRMQTLAGPHLDVEAQHLVNVVLTFPAADAALTELGDLVRRSDFRSPETRRAALHRLNLWLDLQAVGVGNGYSTVSRPAKESRDTTGRLAEQLAEAQIARADLKSDAVSRDERQTWCVLGVVAAIAESAALAIRDAQEVSAAQQTLSLLTQAANSAAAMDAFYLFFAPAPSEPLSEAEARRMILDLQAIAAAKAA